MEEKYHIGDFGEMEFIYRFLRNGKKEKNWYDLFITITDVERYYIEVADNNGACYIIQKRDVKKWVKEESKNQVEIIEK